MFLQTLFSSVVLYSFVFGLALLFRRSEILREEPIRQKLQVF